MHCARSMLAENRLGHGKVQGRRRSWQRDDASQTAANADSDFYGSNPPCRFTLGRLRSSAPLNPWPGDCTARGPSRYSKGQSDVKRSQETAERYRERAGLEDELQEETAKLTENSARSMKTSIATLSGRIKKTC